MRKHAYCVVLVCVLSCSLSLGAKLPFTFDAMMKVARIDDPQLSPDGLSVAFTVQNVDLASNTKPAQIYVVPVAGGAPRRLTPDGSSSSRPRWTPDSKRIVFESDRSNGSQIWSMNADGTDSKQVTSIPTEAAGVSVSPDGKLIVFTSDVYPACSAPRARPGVDYDSSCNKTSLDAEAASKMK